MESTQPLLVLLSAPSGAGKTTLGQQLLQARPQFKRAITCTTRQPRPGEQEGTDYYFLSRDSFEKRIARNEFLEHAEVYNNHYGTLKSEVIQRLDAGHDVLLTVDVQGADTIRHQALQDARLHKSFFSVFLTPGSIDELERRLRKRNQDAPEVIATRLNEARREITQWNQFDYLLISTTIPEDLRRMLAIVDAEKMRRERAVPPKV